MKQGDSAEKFYFIHDGLCEVMYEKEDYIFFEYEEVEYFVNNREA